MQDIRRTELVHAPAFGLRGQIPQPTGPRLDDRLTGGRRQGNELHRLPVAVPVDPGVGVAPQKPLALQQPEEHKGRHGLVGPLPQHTAQGVVPQPRLAAAVHDVHRQHPNCVGDDLHAGGHGGDLHGGIRCQLPAASCRNPAVRALQTQAGRGGLLPPQPGKALADTHFVSPPPRLLSTAPAMASTPPAISPAGR